MATFGANISECKMKVTDLAKPKEFFLLPKKIQFLLKCISENDAMKVHKGEIRAWVIKIYNYGQQAYKSLEDDYFNDVDNDSDFRALVKIYLNSVDVCENYTSKNTRCNCPTLHKLWLNELKQLAERIIGNLWCHFDDKENDVSNLSLNFIKV